MVDPMYIFNIVCKNEYVTNVTIITRCIMFLFVTRREHGYNLLSYTYHDKIDVQLWSQLV